MFLRDNSGGMYAEASSQERTSRKQKRLIIGLLIVIGCLLILCAGLLVTALHKGSGEDASAGAEAESSAILEMPEGTRLWAREQLDENDQALYDAVAAAIACHDPSPITVSDSTVGLDVILTAVRIDHPEFFWFGGEAVCNVVTPAGGETETTCTLTYTMDADDARDQLSVIEAYVQDCLAAVEASGAEDDYGSILAVYRYIISNTDYVPTATDQSFLSVVRDHTGTCAGYSRAFQYIMHRLGIPCTMAFGYGEDGESHGWNIVSCGGDWYQIDVTWGDPLDADGNPGEDIVYTYCMLTDKEIYRNHTLANPLPVPECTATLCNYYRKSGLYFYNWDSVSYETKLRAAVDAGESWFTVRYDGETAYTSAVDALITQAGIVTMLDYCGAEAAGSAVTYTVDDMFYEIAVKLK